MSDVPLSDEDYRALLSILAGTPFAIGPYAIRLDENGGRIIAAKIREADSLRSQVASLTAERDQACANAAQAMHAARVIEASALARLEKAREALAVWLRPAPHPDAPYDEYEAWQAEEQKALDAMTSALGEP